MQLVKQGGDGAGSGDSGGMAFPSRTAFPGVQNKGEISKALVVGTGAEQGGVPAVEFFEALFRQVGMPGAVAAGTGQSLLENSRPPEGPGGGDG